MLSKCTTPLILSQNILFSTPQKSRNFLMASPTTTFVDAEERHSSIVDSCTKQNLTQLESSDCVNDNEMAARRNRVTRVCDAIKDDPGAYKKLAPFVDSKRIFVLKYRYTSWPSSHITSFLGSAHFSRKTMSRVLQFLSKCTFKLISANFFKC